MWKKIVVGVTASALLAATASAELFNGVTAARDTLTLTCSSIGLPAEVSVKTGMRVSEGETLAKARAEKVFASQEGTVARVLHDSGENASGDVIELAPLSRYVVYASVSSGRSTADNRLIRSGETVYMKCKKNGTHLAIGRVYSVDGETYMIETTGGELYVGEVVYVYRESDMNSKALIGTGTVVESDTEKYQSSGRIDEMYVAEGEYVERGQLLYTVIPEQDNEITSPVDGIIYSVETSGSETGTASGSNAGSAEASGTMNFSSTTGMTISADTAGAAGGSAMASAGSAETDTSEAAETEYTTTVTLIPDDSICICIDVEEEYASRIGIGDRVEIIYTANEDADPIGGTVREISGSSEDDTYSVWIDPDNAPERIGLNVEARIDLKTE